MKIFLIIISVLTCAVVSFAQQPITATTEDGRKVALYPNGTWRLVTETSSVPNAATGTRSQEGVIEHTYEFIQDYTLQLGSGQASIRFRRGEKYPGRILADHAEIDIKGVSYSVPRGVLYAQPRD